MAAKPQPQNETPVTVPGRLIVFGLGMIGVIWLLTSLGGLRGGAVLLAASTALIALTVWYRRWFPVRATAEFNKVIKGIPGEVRLIRRKCRRNGDQWEVAWKVPTGVTVQGMKRLIGVFEVALDCSCDFWFDRGLMWMRAGTARLPRTVTFADAYGDRARRRRPAGELVFVVGYGRIGLVWVDLTEVPHLLVGGTPGSGKSVFLRQVVVGLAQEYGPDHVRMVLIDLKGGMEFYPFRALPHLWCEVVSDLPELTPMLADLCAELERRMDMFREEGVVSLRHWNDRRPDDRLPYIVVIVDEYGEVSRPVAEASNDTGRVRSSKTSTHAAVSRIARLGRAVGIHLIACTQRPDADVMPGQIKDQLPATVAFRTRSETNSHILLGDKDPAAALLARIKGRAVFQWETNDEVQAPFIEPEDAVALLAEKYGQRVGHDRVTQCPTRNQETEGEAA